MKIFLRNEENAQLEIYTQMKKERRENGCTSAKFFCDNSFVMFVFFVAIFSSTNLINSQSPDFTCFFPPLFLNRKIHYV